MDNTQFKQKYHQTSDNFFADFEHKFLNFSKKYYENRKSFESELEQNFISRFNNFLRSYKLFTQLCDEINLVRADGFNVFSIWNTGHLEVVMHTPFLAALIDPKGTHGQQRLFFEAFMKSFSGLSTEEILSDGWKVICEQERIDLKIVNYKLMKAIFIENKVYSLAHSGQLSRYYKIFHETFNAQGSFIYLTINGESPNEEGFDNSVYDRNKMDIKCISYKVDINNWLRDLTDKIMAPRVKGIVEQYLELLYID